MGFHHSQSLLACWLKKTGLGGIFVIFSRWSFSKGSGRWLCHPGVGEGSHALHGCTH